MSTFVLIPGGWCWPATPTAARSSLGRHAACARTPTAATLSTQRLPNLAAGRGIKLLPRTYIDCIKPFYSDFNGTKERVKLDAGWKYLTIETGHDAMVSAPQELAKLLLQA